VHEFINAIELFTGIVNGLRQKKIALNSPLDEIVLKTSKINLAYIDNRRDAKEKYNFDLWSSIKKQFKDKKDFIDWIKTQGLDEKILYSKSEQFPDFIFKIRKHEDKLICGSLLELKDSKGGSIASLISERSVNLIIQSSVDDEKIAEFISKNLSNIEVFTIKHKRNGEHAVFQFKL